MSWQGKLWQARHCDHIVPAEESLRSIAEYILDNPARQGLVDGDEERPWGGHVSPLPI